MVVVSNIRSIPFPFQPGASANSKLVTGPIAEQILTLSKGCDLLIGTPGRLVDFITNRPHVLTLKRLKYLVIDEADEMLHSDWEAELQQIMSGSGNYLNPSI
jgi:superfamily II DNA/RNA helicase